MSPAVHHQVLPSALQILEWSVQDSSWMCRDAAACAGAAQRDVAQLCGMVCAKAIPTPQKSKPQILVLEPLQSCIQVFSIQFYMLEFSKILKYTYTPSVFRQNMYYHVLSPVASEMNFLLCVVEKKNQK